MKTTIYTKYGSPDVIKIVEVDKPEPKKRSFSKIYATTVNSGDDKLRGGKFSPLVLLPFKLMLDFGKTYRGNSFSDVMEPLAS